MRRCAGRGRLATGCLLIGAIGALGGCAVMTVDVDVYKGPLANEPEVQLQEAAVMAVGAKPLLKEFRDSRELKERASRGMETAVYRGLAAASNEIRGYTFLDANANRANEVMSLFSARHDDPEMATLIRRGLDAVARYDQGYNALRPNPLPPERALLAMQLGRMPLLPAPVKGLSTQEAMDLRAKHVAADPMAAGRAAYLELVRPRKTPTGWVFYEDWLWQAYTHIPARATQSLVLDTNERFRLLADAGYVNGDIDLLFNGLPDSQRERLVATSTRAASGFLEARLALEDLLHVSLDLIERVNSPAFASPSRAAEATAVLADYTARLISGEAITAATSAEFKRGGMIRDLGDAAPLFDETDSVRFSPSRLRLNLAQRPLETLPTLRRLNDVAKRSEGFAFGLARGPTVASDSLSPQVLIERFQALAGALTGGFARGRAEQGLDDLIERFVSTQMENGPASGGAAKTAAEQARKDLLESLIQFAEKVLFIADHAVLLDSSRDSTPGPHGSTLPRPAWDDSYLLQAVGNSILVQVNELQARQNHERRQREAFPRITDAAALGVTEAIETPTAIMDRIIFKLEKCLRDEVVKVDSNQTAVANLKAGVALAHEQRARLVYIRTPSFYLKNSYPVTSLVQNDTQGLWRNSLADHAGRSVPLAGNAIASGGRAARDAVQLQQEIDRRFWQNINRIRVAGAGNTNYALVKDAVGNWYVKNFTADTQPIINAAKAAAVLAARGAPSVVNAALPAAPAVAAATADSGQSPARLQTEYDARTKEDSEAVTHFVESLSSTITARLSELPCASSLIDLTPRLVRELEQRVPKAVLNALDSTGAEREEAIIAALRGVRQFHVAAHSILNESKSELGSAELDACRRAVLRELDAAVSAPLRKHVMRRHITVESHCAALRATSASMSAAQ